MAHAPWATIVQQGASPQFHALLGVFATPQVHPLLTRTIKWCYLSHLQTVSMFNLFISFEIAPYEVFLPPPVLGGVTMESCSACPAGQYCSTEGLAKPSGPCAAGFYCPFDFSSTTPYAFLCPKVRKYSQVLSFFLSLLPHLLWIIFPAPPYSIVLIVFFFCFFFQTAPMLFIINFLLFSTTSFGCTFVFFIFSQGHYCPEGSPLALPCPTGEYQPNPGSQSCIPCRPGFYCEEAIEGEPRPCPPHSFCPAGTLNGWTMYLCDV